MKSALALMLCAMSTMAHSGPPVDGHVVADYEFVDAQSPTQEQRIARAVAEFRNLPELPQVDAVAAAADLAWPLQPIAGFDQFGYHGISNFVDHDARFPGFVQDYACGTRSYDLASGYNHAGTDYYLWPDPWLMMDQGLVQIVAAAPGVIARKDDGNFDRNCALGSGEPNDVFVHQDDGFTAVYMHMRKGSVTAKAVGSRVEVGEYLGQVGSSGSSTGPHLHFELHDASGNVVDPRHGQCNAADDRWAVFQPYEDPHIDSISTHSAEPQFVACGTDALGNPVDETPFFKSTFKPGDVFWVFVSYRDQRSGEVSNFRILRPDGSVFQQWDFDLASQGYPLQFYSGTGFDWMYTLPADAPAGIWSIAATFQGRQYTRTFAVEQSLVLGGYLSGNWYNPAQGGHGFQLEFTSQADAGIPSLHELVAIWFVYTPDGSGQDWIYAQGPYDTTKNSVTVPATIFHGAKFPFPLSNFDPNAVQGNLGDWGNVTFTFTDCNNGTASWTSTVNGYGNGSIPIQRLTTIQGTACPQ